MISGKKILGVIVARGGSKGLPRKNVLDLGGKPLVAWSVDAAHESRFIDKVILSSDDAEIIAAARAHGCDVPFVRPAELAADDTPIADVILHALDAMAEAYDYVVLLQATSPLRTAEDIDGCIQACDANPAAPAAVSVTRPGKPPHWMFELGETGTLNPLLGWKYLRMRRQELPPAYTVNGAIYVARVDWFRQGRSFYGEGAVGYPMPEERSVDIDTAADLAFARSLVL